MELIAMKMAKEQKQKRYTSKVIVRLWKSKRETLLQK
jgi:hypothetical protein